MRDRLTLDSTNFSTRTIAHLRRGTAAKVVAPLIAFLALAVVAAGLAARPHGTNFSERIDDPASSATPVLSPAESVRAMRLVPGFHIELVASEPMVVAPVAMTFDADGRLWVVEMQSYMPDVKGTGELEPNNHVVVLTDTDGDGVMDTLTPFLEHLVLPRAVLPCFGGALVIEPPNLLFCRDNNGDGKADEKRVLISGLGGIESPEHAANGLLWGIDNWIYLSQHNFRFKFDGTNIITEPTPNHGQWGITTDEVGRLYYTPNSDTLRGDLFPKHYASENPDQRRVAGMNEKIGLDLAVWPAHPTGVNRGYMPKILGPDRRLANVTAACGPSIYLASQFPPEFRGDAFVCEPAGNLVKRLTMREYNAVPVGTNAYFGYEFLTSTDERFRPVASCVGPDGSLYLADMYRGVIQHRVFITPYLTEYSKEHDLEAPLGCGRIYRVVADRAAQSSPIDLSQLLHPNLSGASDIDLVAMLGHRDQWWRITAQRLLVERRATSIAPQLRQSLHSAPDRATRLHALWTLDGLGSVEITDALQALADAEPALRAAAIRIAERWTLGDQTINSARRALLDAVITRANDPDRTVRIQAALSLPRCRDSLALEAVVALLRENADDEFLRSAAVTGLVDQEVTVLNTLCADPAWPHANGERRLLAELAECALRSKSEEIRASLLDRAAADLTPSPARAKLLLDTIRNELRIGSDQPKLLKLAREPGGWSAAVNAASNKHAAEITRYLDWPGRDASTLPPLVRALTDDERAQFQRGAKLFEACVGCHGASGQGTAAQIPPLAGSSRVLGTADRLARILLHGLEGDNPIDGITYQGLMPPAPTQTDDDLAAVMTYVRRAWGNTADPVKPETITAVRKATAERKTPWHIDELDKEH